MADYLGTHALAISNNRPAEKGPRSLLAEAPGSSQRPLVTLEESWTKASVLLVGTAQSLLGFEFVYLVVLRPQVVT